jgi:hypothetical protein
MVLLFFGQNGTPSEYLSGVIEVCCWIQPLGTGFLHFSLLPWSLILYSISFIKIPLVCIGKQNHANELRLMSELLLSMV